VLKYLMSFASENRSGGCSDIVRLVRLNLMMFLSTNDILYMILNNYTVSQKNDNDVLHYNFNAHQPILITFGRDIAE